MNFGDSHTRTTEEFIPEYEFITSNTRAQEVSDLLSKEKVLALDTETTGLDPYVARTLLVQFATNTMAYVIDCDFVDIELFRGVLEDKNILKLIQNAKFDYKMIRVHFDIVIRNIYCTMLAERVLTTGKKTPLNLKHLAKKYLGFELTKEVRKAFVNKTNKGYTNKELHYAALDAIILHEIYEQQVQELLDVGLIEVALLEFRTCPAVAEMELAGCVLDRDKWENITDLVRKDRDKIGESIMAEFAGVVTQHTLFGIPQINLGSPTQMVKYFNRLDIRDSKGEKLPDTSEETLSEIRGTYPLVDEFLLYREVDTLMTRYGLAFLDKIHKKTGRLHANFNQFRADTGRFSSSSPNLQQVPGSSMDEDFGDKNELVSGFKSIYAPRKGGQRFCLAELRSCFRATPGFQLVGADYSQQELRVLADASGDPAFGNAYLNDIDAHTNTAAGIFGVPVEKVTKKQRSVGKTINFAIVYGAGPWKVANSLGITEDEAKGHINKFFSFYSGLKGFLGELSSFAVRNGYSYTILGRRRYYELPEYSDPEYKKKISRIERQAKNHYVQGSSADITKQALIYTHEAIEKEGLDAKVLMVIHDEIIMEARKEQAERAARILEDCMVRGFTAFFKKIPAKVDASISNYWTKG